MNRNYGNTGLRKTHYDSKGAIALEFKYAASESTEAFSMGKAFDDDMSIGMDIDSNYVDAFDIVDNEGFDDLQEFSGGFSQAAFVMAKAYDEDAEIDSADAHSSEISTAKAYDDASTEPADRDNQYSDVFESADDEIFSNASKSPAHALEVNEMADEVEVDDQFAKDLQAVLSGQKSLANLADYSEAKTAPATAPPANDDTDSRLKKLEEKMAKDEAIFDQLAADRNNLTTYQLGEVELQSIFDEADDDLSKGASIALAKNRIEDIIDETSIAMDGMEYAEDFELMDSIAEDELAESKNAASNSNSNPDIKDAVIEEEIVVSPEDNTVSE